MWVRRLADKFRSPVLPERAMLLEGACPQCGDPVREVAYGFEIVLGPDSIASLPSAVLDASGIGNWTACPRGHEALLGLEWRRARLQCWTCRRTLSPSKNVMKCSSCAMTVELEGLGHEAEAVVVRAVDAIGSGKPATDIGRYLDWAEERSKLLLAIERGEDGKEVAQASAHGPVAGPGKAMLPALKAVYGTPKAVEGSVRYSLLGLIGVGGFAKIHLAQAPDGRFLVIKEAWGFRTPDEKGRDQRVNPYALAARKLRLEAEYLRQVAGQARVPQFLEHFEANGGSYVAMEFIHGPNLREYVQAMAPRNNGLEVSEALRTFRAAAETVRLIHGMDRVHRDLTPRNVLMRAGNPILIDFGTIAKDTGLTPGVQTGISAGGYHAPEQGQGVSSPLCDVFSLGSCLYFLLTGKDPPDAKPDGSSQDELREEMTRQGVPPALRDIVLRSRAWAPWRRYQDVDALLRAVHLVEHPDVRVCAQCGAFVQKRARHCGTCRLRYCTECGAAVGYEPSCAGCGRRICPWCSTSTPRDFPACQGCGARLRVRACVRCQARVPAGTAFCRGCGARFAA